MCCILIQWQDNFVESAVIGTYCQCGTVEEAAKTFTTLPSNNMAAWNAKAMGFA